MNEKETVRWKFHGTVSFFCSSFPSDKVYSVPFYLFLKFSNFSLLLLRPQYKSFIMSKDIFEY